MKWKDKKTEAISHRALYVLTGLIALVFALFFVVGYSRPSLLAPNFNDPLFTPLVILLSLLLVVAAIGAALWSAVEARKAGRNSEKQENGIPVRRLTRGVAIAVAAALVLFFATGSTTAIRINGEPYADAFWLRSADALIRTSALLIVAVVGAAVFMQLRKRK